VGRGRPQRIGERAAAPRRLPLAPAVPTPRCVGRRVGLEPGGARTHGRVLEKRLWRLGFLIVLFYFIFIFLMAGDEDKRPLVGRGCTDLAYFNRL